MAVLEAIATSSGCSEFDRDCIMTTLPNEAGVSNSLETTAEDSNLLAAVGLGDERAMASLYDRYSTLVYSVALRVCRDSISAEEVVQNLFLQLWLAPQQFASQPGSLDGRLGLLSRNLAIEFIRKRKSAESAEKSHRTPSSKPLPHTEVSLLLQKPHALVLLLPDVDRQVLDMAFFDGKTAVEIAEETGFPVDTIASRLRGALSNLRNEAAVAATVSEDTGLEVLDLDTHIEFTSRGVCTPATLRFKWRGCAD